MFFAPTRREVNKWIEENTGGMIKDMVRSPSLESPHFLLLIVNTVYFNGAFSEKFEESMTQSDVPFFKSNNRKEEVNKCKMMNKSWVNEWYSGDFKGNTMECVKLGYKKSRFCLILVRPKEEGAFPKL